MQKGYTESAFNDVCHLSDTSCRVDTHTVQLLQLIISSSPHARMGNWPFRTFFS